ncbi:hypothetical protein D9757_000847 [Collybiopsis confluens]|uniref:Uncharacterized protein n=1 Tax=Collybiopsis confluens TaxID=2823264 RepID=A0A8H5I0N6_9AGAR|nr:hypothetical protein D9757_000847 [Collybiopsis confluens]
MMSSMSLQARSSDPKPYSVTEALLAHWIPPVISSVLYVCYLPLSILCIRTVYRRKRGEYEVFLSAMVLLLLASTESMIVQWVNQSRAVRNLEAALKSSSDGGNTSQIVQNSMQKILLYDDIVLGIYVFSNVVADALLIYRCWAIWNRDKRIVFLPALGYLVNIIVGILGLAFDKKLVIAFWIVTVVENVTLTLLTAGKIWYIKNEVAEILGSASKIRYNTIVAVILESGFIYSSIVLLTSITALMSRNAIYASCFLAASTQIVAITPALIIIRMAKGLDTRDVQASISIMTRANSNSSRGVQDVNGRATATDQDANTVQQQQQQHQKDITIEILRTSPSFHTADTEALLITSSLSDLELEEGRRSFMSINSSSMGLDRRGEYAAVKNQDQDNEDDEGYSSAQPTPNAQVVEFARSDLMMIGHVGMDGGGDSNRKGWI